MSEKGRILKSLWGASQTQSPGHLQPLACSQGAKALGRGSPAQLANEVTAEPPTAALKLASAEPRGSWTTAQHHGGPGHPPQNSTPRSPSAEGDIHLHQ